MLNWSWEPCAKKRSEAAQPGFRWDSAWPMYRIASWRMPRYGSAPNRKGSGRERQNDTARRMRKRSVVGSAAFIWRAGTTIQAADGPLERRNPYRAVDA